MNKVIKFLLNKKLLLLLFSLILSFNSYGEDILLDYDEDMAEEIQEIVDRGIEASRCSSPPVDYGLGLPPERTEQQKVLRSAWVNNIAARVKSTWFYQGAEDDWWCEVAVFQKRNGEVFWEDVNRCKNIPSNKEGWFKGSISRAVYEASPLPLAPPDDFVFNCKMYFTFFAD